MSENDVGFKEITADNLVIGGKALKIRRSEETITAVTKQLASQGVVSVGFECSTYSFLHQIHTASRHLLYTLA